MSSVSIAAGSTTRLAIPRGSLWFGTLAAMLINGIKRIDEWQIRRREQRSNDVEDLLALANRVEATDPGFASDLRCAAIRGSERPQT